MAIVKTPEFREHANILDSEPTSLLVRLIDSAQDHLERHLGYEIETRFDDNGLPDLPPSLKLAVLMLAAHYYENREATLVGVTAVPLPFGLPEIIASYRDWSF